MLGSEFRFRMLSGTCLKAHGSWLDNIPFNQNDTVTDYA
jgi:hypothetical protein